MHKYQPLNFTSKPELFLLISVSILIFLAGSMLLLTGFGMVVLVFLWKGKISNTFDKFFEELFEF